MKTQVCEYNGKHYTQPERLAKDADLTLVQAERVFYGHDTEILPGAVAKNTITYKGTEFSSVRQLAKHLQYTTNILGRLVREYGVVEEGVEAYSSMTTARSVTVFGKQFRNKVEVYREYDVPKHVIEYMMRSRSISLEEAITQYKDRENDGIEYNGRTFATYSELFAAYDIPVHIGRQRLASNWGLDRIVTEPIHSTRATGAKLVFRGKTYGSREELASAFKLAFTPITNAASYKKVSWGAAFLAFVDLFENYIGFPEENLTRRPFAVYDGIWFMSAADLSKHLNIDHMVYSKVRYSLLRELNAKDEDESVGLFDVYKRITEMTSVRYRYEGKLYTYMELDRIFPKTVVFAKSNGLAEEVEVRDYPECTYDDTKQHVEVRAVFDTLVEKYRGEDIEVLEEAEEEVSL